MTTTADHIKTKLLADWLTSTNSISWHHRATRHLHQRIKNECCVCLPRILSQSDCTTKLYLGHNPHWFVDLCVTLMVGSLVRLAPIWPLSLINSQCNSGLFIRLLSASNRCVVRVLAWPIMPATLSQDGCYTAHWWGRRPFFIVNDLCVCTQGAPKSNRDTEKLHNLTVFNSFNLIRCHINAM